MGTPGGSGGWAGACGWGWACCWGTGRAGSVAGWLRGGGWARWVVGLAAGRAATAVLRAIVADFRATEAIFGRNDLALGLAFAFEVVIRPFALERLSELRSARLQIRRYRSTLLIQV